MSSRKAEFLMASVAFAWGSSYLLMKIGLNNILPFNLIALRFGIAFICMILLFRKRFKELNTTIIKSGLLMGGLLFLIFTGMVCGVNQTTASAAGFLTSTTVIIVPILECITKRKLPDRTIIINVCLVTIGLYFITVQGNVAVNAGSVYCLFGAFSYAVYIIVLDKISKKSDTLLISIIQLGVASILGMTFMLLLEKPSLPATPGQWAAIICLGLVCSAYGFIVQPIAQKYTSPERIGLIFSLEPVFSAILSYIFLHETLQLRGYLGAALVFCGVVSSKLYKNIDNRYNKAKLKRRAKQNGGTK